MSNLILPPGITLPNPIQPKETVDENIPMEERGRSLPEPTGWKILCVVPDVSDKIDGTELDLIKSTAALRQEEHGTTVLFVVKVGPQAYKDEAKFGGEAWCKKGDFILVRTYSGTRFKIYGKEFRLLNDDQVDAVVQDPRGYSRA
jgi:co-chaperonin GroES (HSP10)